MQKPMRNSRVNDGLFGSLKYMTSYAAYVSIAWFVIIIGFYLIGIPIGIGSFPGVLYGA